jgi:hypothetical protein
MERYKAISVLEGFIKTDLFGAGVFPFDVNPNNEGFAWDRFSESSRWLQVSGPATEANPQTVDT